MSTQNGINGFPVTTGAPYSAGTITVDPFPTVEISGVQYQISGTNKYLIGSDPNNSQAFEIKPGTDASASAFILTSSGYLTLPLQPCFGYAINAEALVSGDGTNHVIGSTTALTLKWDQASSMTTGGTFTAPIAGNYLFSFNPEVTLSALGGNYFQYKVVTTNRTYTCLDIPGPARLSSFSGTSGNMSYTCEVIANMSAADTATFNFVSTGGTKVDSILDGFITGYLIT